MANTYTLINSTSLSTTAASVTFSAIPATYDDLILSISARGSDNSAYFNLTFNSIGGTSYSRTVLMGDGSTAQSFNSSSQANILTAYINRSDYTASSFGSMEIYIPAYRVSQNKPLSIIGAQETNATTASQAAIAGLMRDTAAITSVVCTYPGASTFASGSTFWLYGIKNS